MEPGCLHKFDVGNQCIYCGRLKLGYKRCVRCKAPFYAEKWHGLEPGCCVTCSRPVESQEEKDLRSAWACEVERNNLQRRKLDEDGRMQEWQRCAGRWYRFRLFWRLWWRRLRSPSHRYRIRGCPSWRGNCSESSGFDGGRAIEINHWNTALHFQGEAGIYFLGADDPIRFCPWCGARVQLYPIPKEKA